jgi:hypothetical protein
VTNTPDEQETKRGRPTVYTPELGDAICALLAEGETLNAICKRDEIPVSESTVRGWALNAEHPFSANYARAREVGYHKLADETLDIADAQETDPGQVARDRLRVDTRKWLLSKALPKIYGDKLALGGDQDAPPITLRTIERVIVRPGDQNSGVEAENE